MYKSPNDKNIGVITEQGFPAGQFGFEPLKEQDQEKVKTDIKQPEKK